MSDQNRPVMDLLRGPVQHTPQGWVVLVTGVLYGLIALTGALLGVSPSIAKSPDHFFTICVAWPFCTFLFFVRGGSPHFMASLSQAVHLAVAALAPIGFALLRNFL